MHASRCVAGMVRPPSTASRRGLRDGSLAISGFDPRSAIERRLGCPGRSAESYRALDRSPSAPPRLAAMQASSTAVLARFEGSQPGAPKHLRLRAAIIDAVHAGELPAGTKISGERELSAALGVSLGTTQKALGRLVDDGFLVRRHGHGTFVGSARRPVRRLVALPLPRRRWHERAAGVHDDRRAAPRRPAPGRGRARSAPTPRAT